MDSPQVVHRLAAVVRLVDAFTGLPVRAPFDVRLAGQEWWRPLYRDTDATYRFLVSNRAVPSLGTVAVRLTPLDPAATHRDIGGLSVTIPPAGPAPVPLTPARFLHEHPVWPTRTFAPPPGETVVLGRVRRAGAPVADQRVRLATGGAPGAGAPAAPTDADGAFVYRLPALKVQATAAGVVTTAGLFAAVRDAAGTPQALSAPAMPVTVPLGRATALTLDLA